jgi:hypothetical protein
MTIRQQKIFSAVSVAISVVGSLEALVYILNLNQIAVFLNLILCIYVYMVVKMTFLYDLHFKNRGALARARVKHENVGQWYLRTAKICLTGIWDRLHHLRRWVFLRHFQNYLLLPTLIFLSTAALLYLNFGRILIQQIFIILSSAALVLNYWNLKEVFARKREVVDQDIFAALSLVKLFTSFTLYCAILGLALHFCLPGKYVLAGVFCVTALMVFQALFQHNKMKSKIMFESLWVAFVLAFAAYFANRFWSYNYFTAGTFLMACYNFCWGIFHHRIDKTLNFKNFIELFIITALIVYMLFSVTNFRERLMFAC